ncbi:DUF99 family protein [Candidatus Woesearchaeota archaeon]|nr:DUF99 family protein [Candidatus Woesearchaeota archaeon]
MKIGVKKEIRVLGVDDGPFDKFRDKECLVVGTLYRGGNYPDGILSAKVKVDGSDSTKALVSMVNRSKFKPQLQAIILDGIALGGFNVVDIESLNKKTGIPVIVVVRAYPDFDEIIRVLKKLKKHRQINLIEKAGKPVKAGKVWVQFKGTSFDRVKEIISITSTRSHLPEPVRVAHLIASGIIKGESRGDA